VERA
jgi:hypothetical protein